MNKALIAVGICLASVWLAVTLISLGTPYTKGFYYDVPNKDMPTVIFIILFSLAFVLYFAMSFMIMKKKPGRSAFLIIIFFSILFRAVLLPSVAVHENDFYRYIWDGKVIKSGINPYKYAPADVESSEPLSGDLAALGELRKDNPIYFERIGHRQVPTIYPPAAQSVFFLSNIVKKNSILTMKTIFIIFDVLAILLIAGLLRHFGKNPSLCIIYGWSPLVLKEIANSAHYDSMAIFFMLLFIYFAFKNYLFAGTLSLAFAGLAKFFPLVLIPIYLKRIKIRNALLCAVILILAYTPFFLWGNTGIKKVFEGLGTYSEMWAHNGGIYTLLQASQIALKVPANAPFIVTKLILGVIFTSALLYLCMKKNATDIGLLHRSFIALSLLFLLSPVGNPWYFCWVMPFLCFFPYRSFIVLSWLLIFSYLSFGKSFGMVPLGPLKLPFLLVIQYAPFFALLALELFLKRAGKVRYV